MDVILFCVDCSNPVKCKSSMYGPEMRYQFKCQCKQRDICGFGSRRDAETHVKNKIWKYKKERKMKTNKDFGLCPLCNGKLLDKGKDKISCPSSSCAMYWYDFTAEQWKKIIGKPSKLKETLL